LSAPTTHASLVLLELKAAAEEYLRATLVMPDASGKALLQALHDRGALEPQKLERLVSSFAKMEQAEKAMLGSENLRIRRESIKKVHRELTEILPSVGGTLAAKRPFL
jgi:hypothetical protein